MKHTVLALVLAALVAACGVRAEETSDAALRQKAESLMQAGNWKDAYDIWSKRLVDAAADPMRVGENLLKASQCLQNLGRSDELDDMRAKTIAVHAKNWRLMLAAAQNLINDPHFGYRVAGKFYRGNHRGGGQYMMSNERDRVQALQLMVQAAEATKADADKNAVSGFYLQYASMLLHGGGRETWRLQYLTDLKELPDYEEYNHRRYYGGEQRGAPVDIATGMPIFYSTPKSFESAKSDGERWRWALSMCEEMSAQNAPTVRLELANFLQQQFDVRSMSGSNMRGWGGGEEDGKEGKEEESGPFAVSTLGEEETIAKLATGIKRFKLPDEFNFIKIYQQIAKEFKGRSEAESSIGWLAQSFEDRQQYEKAADQYRRSIAEYGDPNKYKQQRLDQILGSWGTFESAALQPAGKAASVEYRFRNGNKVSFTAQEIDIKKLLGDVKEYLKANPKQVDWQRMDISNIGYRLVQQNQMQYVGAQVAQWDVDVKARDKHFDKRVSVKTPLEKPGAYFVTATINGGNTSRIVLWVADTAIVKKQLSKQGYYFVADALTGQPIPNANVEFFGYQQRHVKDNNWTVDTAAFAEVTDADGQVKPGPDKMTQNFQWIATATTADGRFAYQGFAHSWFGEYNDPQYLQNKAFIITDRPVYRPNQPVKFKCWVGQAKYDQVEKSPFGGSQFTLQITNPKGEKILEKQFQADDYGGFDGEMTLDKEATLGQYNVQVAGWWPGSAFRLEEYKKPEFEVKIDAPVEPVMLGEKITATINAKYYFGAPVTDAKVKYKVTRTDYTANWYPAGRWDWFYEPGYWWFAEDYPWYPGWRGWGCKRPYPWWYGPRQQQPEMVMENEVPVGADGTVKVEIDTAVAKAIHGDTDHKYEISAEVTDQSRRTIVGTGSVMVARNPFKVYAWVDQGHYHVGDAIRADFSAQTLDNKPVKGKGLLKLLKVKYDKDGKADETRVQEWDLETDAQGKSTQQIKAAEAGQYRISYKVTDAKNHSVEGGYVFTVIGEGFDGSQFRFNNIELLTDKREYKSGDKVRLMVNTNRVGGVVVLFTRPANGMYLPPKIIRLKGKSTIEEIEVAKADMPNFFIEAFTISDGHYYSAVREIVVPPESKVLDVTVVPNAAQYKPGEKAKITLKLTDPTGEPFSGSTVVTVYDKAVEYISGGSNVPEIKSHFWKWRRNHHEQSVTNLTPYSANVLKPNELAMQYLGAFGYLTADLGEDDERAASDGKPQARGKSGGVGGARREMDSLRKAGAAPGAPTAANAMDAAGEGMAFGAMEKQKSLKEEGGKDRAGRADQQSEQVGETMAEPTVRKNFADSAFWVAKLQTGANGIAEIEVPMPENLTTWKVKVWGMGQGLRVGQGETEVITSKNLLVRLQAPRFFTEKDEVVISANVHNYLSMKKNVKVVLEMDGKCLDMDANDAKVSLPTQTVEIEAKGEKRIDWRVKVTGFGEALVRVKALTDEESDAMEMKFPAYVHGMPKVDSFAGAMRPDKNEAGFAFSIPAQRREADSRLEVRYSPTLAGAMVDALPYLVDYPYGCTEQTLSRFLPTVMTQKVLMRMNLNLKEVQAKVTNLNAQEIGDDVARSKQWKRYDHNPVFDEEEVSRMVQAGIDRLGSMQCGDGGWGWFSGWGEASYPHTTAYVVHGLQTAKANGVKLPQGMLERGVQWLQNYQKRELALLRNAPTKTQPYKEKADNLDAFVFMTMTDAAQKNPEMLELLFRDKVSLAVYSKAMFGIALQKLNEKEKLAEIVKNIEQFLVQDEENQTAYLKLPEDNYWWYWYGSEYEAQAYYLKLLSATDPKGEKASRLVKYLINNRKNASYWNSTRDTAVCVEAMAEYLTASGEDGPDMKLEILIDGKKAKEVSISASNLFTFDNKLVLSGNKLSSGEHKVEFKKTGRGPLYFNAYVNNFTLEDNIKKTGLEIKVDRKFYKLTRLDKSEKVQGAQGQAVDQKVEKYERHELKNLDTLKSGDLVEIELEIDSKNDYEYILFEDMKAAGFEPVDVRSGYNNNSLHAYMELRDERVCLFARQLPRGKNSVSYRVRAEIPGKFSALPTKASAMYAPELKANSDEMKVNIRD